MTVIGDERAKNATGITGFGMKLLGGIILAVYWIFAFIAVLMHHVNPETFEATEPFDEIKEPGIIDVFTSGAFIHAAGFSLIVSGWIAENSKRKKVKYEIYD